MKNRRAIDEAGWVFTFLAVSTALTAVLGDLGDIYVVGDDAYLFVPLVFLLSVWAALVASRWLVLLGRSRSSVRRRAARRVTLLISVGALGMAAVLVSRPPLSDVVGWHLHGFPAPRRYPGIQRYQIEALLILRSLLPVSILLVGGLVAFRSTFDPEV